jgi:hypothetical protein
MCKTIGFDVDMVVLDIATAFQNTAKEVLGRDVEKVTNNRELFSRFGLNLDEGRAVKKEMDWGNFPLMPWAERLISTIRYDLKYNVIFVSAFNNKKQDIRFGNLRKFFDVDQNDVHCVGRAQKSITLSAYGANTFVDDCPNQVRECQDGGIKDVFLLDFGFDDIDRQGIQKRISSDYVDELFCYL